MHGKHTNQSASGRDSEACLPPSAVTFDTLLGECSMCLTTALSGRRGAKRRGHPAAQLTGAPLERIVGRHFHSSLNSPMPTAISPKPVAIDATEPTIVV